MPYYLSKVTDCLKNIPKESRATFMIDQLSAYVFSKYPLLVADWFKNIERAMQNPKKIINILLLQPDTKKDLNNSIASFILHLCPDNAIKGFISILKDERINWIEKHNSWLQNFETEENDEEIQQDSEDESESESESESENENENENEDSVPDCVTDIYNYLQEDLFSEFIRKTIESNEISELGEYFRYLQFRFGDKLETHWDNIINTIGLDGYGEMDEEWIDLLLDMPGAPICSWNRDNDNLSSDDDLSDADSMPELVDDDDEIIYERDVLPWWNEDRAGLLRV
jgi:hypothetical protein